MHWRNHWSIYGTHIHISLSTIHWRNHWSIYGTRIHVRLSTVHWRNHWSIYGTHIHVSLASLDISTGPLARHTFQTTGPVWASTFFLSLAPTGHLDICRATRFKIVLARMMTNHSMYFSRRRKSHLSVVLPLSFCYSETPAWRESE